MYSMTADDLETNADIVKIAILKALVSDGMIPLAETDRWCSLNTIIFRKKSIFRTITSLWDKTEEIESLLIKLVKAKPLPNADDVIAPE